MYELDKSLSLHDRTQVVKRLITVGSGAYYQAGKELRHIGKTRQYTEGYTTFKEYVEQNYHFKVSTAYNLIGVVEKCGRVIEQHGDMSFGIQKLFQALPLINSDSDAETWYAEAQVLSPKDFEYKVREAKGMAVPDSCNHEMELEMYFRCPECNGFVHQDHIQQYKDKSTIMEWVNRLEE
jgi:hypothetical protein